ncbi:DUF4271 domain-containing protein [Chitinophaga sp. Hz27]|uniref:DUF4271 domain-containing protein n=1 Tax=Chitinophaga sp. Hz27 TaxID=3347169 RepID=UPI0035D747BD
MAQQADSSARVPADTHTTVIRHVADTSRPKPRAIKPRTDSTGRSIAVRRDTTRHIVAAPIVHKDSTRLATDTSHIASDSTKVAAVPKVKPVSFYDIYMKKLVAENVFLKPGKPSYADVNPIRPFHDLDWLVYVVAGITLLIAVIRLAYQKYFHDLFRAFLNPTLSQRQLKDQLSQSPFPNFLLNAFFIISLGMYLYLVLYRKQVFPQAEPWMLIPGLIALVAIVYGTKYVMLRFCGWLFGNADLADAYIFILYLINKILGVLLVPFLVVMAFCSPEIAQTFLYISIFFIILLIIYRYIRSYSLVKQYLSFSKLHFFLYLCAFEVAPVLILTKVLLNIWLTGNP